MQRRGPAAPAQPGIGQLDGPRQRIPRPLPIEHLAHNSPLSYVVPRGHPRPHRVPPARRRFPFALRRLAPPAYRPGAAVGGPGRFPLPGVPVLVRRRGPGGVRVGAAVSLDLLGQQPEVAERVRLPGGALGHPVQAAAPQFLDVSPAQAGLVAGDQVSGCGRAPGAGLGRSHAGSHERSHGSRQQARHGAEYESGDRSVSFVVSTESCRLSGVDRGERPRAGRLAGNDGSS